MFDNHHSSGFSSPSPTPPPSGFFAKKNLGIMALIVVMMFLVGLVAVLLWDKFFPASADDTAAPVSNEEKPSPKAVLPVEEKAGEPSAETENSFADQDADTDGDGLSDREENELKTNPRKADSDSDGLFDYDEVRIYKTDPLNSDTDGDGYLDGEEVLGGYNPRGPGKLLNFNQEVNKMMENK